VVVRDSQENLSRKGIDCGKFRANLRLKKKDAELRTGGGPFAKSPARVRNKTVNGCLRVGVKNFREQHGSRIKKIRRLTQSAVSAWWKLRERPGQKEVGGEVIGKQLEVLGLSEGILRGGD